MTARRALVIALLAAAGVVVSVAAAGPNDRGRGGKGMKRQLAGVNFISSCRFSHRAMDDPIVFPGRPGLSHDHSFVGNVSTSAFSTVDSLRSASTTCQRPADTAAYWMPTLSVAGTPVTPQGATIYYRRRTDATVRPFPAGLKMIAGSSRATSPQSLAVTYWNCGAQTGIAPSSTVPTCPDGARASLRLHVNFPDCWDGANLDSPDHQMHMAYSTRGSCPATHPVAVPRISLIYKYPSAGGPDVTLASGGQFSAHADFFNAWKQGQLTRLVNSCLNALRHCGRGT
jgi:Domain of unknown function (DUF1996)